MLVLGIETSTDYSSVSLVDENGILAEIRIGRARRHVETVAPSIEALLRVVDTGIAGVDGVAVDVGPGLFTGLRVGMATAKSLCYALGIRAIAVGSLDVLAGAVSRTVSVECLDGWTLLPVVDMKRGGLFWNTYAFDGAAAPTAATAGVAAGAVIDAAAYITAPPAPVAASPPAPAVASPPTPATLLAAGGTRLVATGSPKLSTPGELVEFLVSAIGSGELRGKVLMAGNGAMYYAEEFSRLVVHGVKLGGSMLAVPSAGVLASMGLEKLKVGECVDVGRLSPQYAREPDAIANWKRRDGS